MKTFLSKGLSTLTRAFCASLILSALAIPSRAAGTTYTYTDGGGDFDFNNAANWNPSTAAPGTIVVPGVTTSYTNTDIALFNGAAGTTAGLGVVIDSGVNRDLEELEFLNDDASDLESYTIGSAADTLYFTYTGTPNILAGYTGAGNVPSPTETIARYKRRSRDRDAGFLDGRLWS